MTHMTENQIFGLVWGIYGAGLLLTVFGLVTYWFSLDNREQEDSWIYTTGPAPLFVALLWPLGAPVLVAFGLGAAVGRRLLTRRWEKDQQRRLQEAETKAAEQLLQREGIL